MGMREIKISIKNERISLTGLPIGWTGQRKDSVNVQLGQEKISKMM